MNTQDQSRAQPVAAHTPTPYSLPLEIRQTPQGPRIVDAEGEPVAEAYTERGAEAMIHACNSHAALVKALEKIARELSVLNSMGQCTMPEERALKTARAALQLAKQ